MLFLFTKFILAFFKLLTNHRVCNNIVITPAPEHSSVRGIAMQIQTVFKAGNSNVVAIPSSVAKELGIKPGKKVAVTHSSDSITFSTRIPKTSRYETIADKEFVDLIKEVESRYGSALEELANLP